MSNTRTCKRCHQKTRSYTNYCSDCYPKVIAGVKQHRRHNSVVLSPNAARIRLFDSVDLFLLCTDDYIGVTPKQMAGLYDRDEAEIIRRLAEMKKDGRYEFYLSRWRLKDAYDLYLGRVK